MRKEVKEIQAEDRDGPEVGEVEKRIKLKKK